ncbi:MAG: aminoglycoside phosphotransferase family protein, partial [bacterium]|nr:aminoglycoside phosphotransferase family protein [bacterium]
DADQETGRRAIKEQKMLEWLHQRSTSFLVPEPFGIVWFSGMMAFATSYMEGVPVELRVSKSYGKPPWEIVGSIAAEIHQLPVLDLPSDKSSYPTWRDHVVEAVSTFKSLKPPEIQEAVDWIEENLPPGEPSVLLHGDLLGQNIVWPLSDKYCVLDWEYSFLGDPAYDLAIVTRGVRRPFQIPEGLDYLIDSYREAGGSELAKINIQVHELLMLLGWYKWSLGGTYGGHGPYQYLARMKSYLRRL